jgi:hypothetical protein
MVLLAAALVVGEHQYELMHGHVPKDVGYGVWVRPGGYVLSMTAIAVLRRFACISSLVYAVGFWVCLCPMTGYDV